MNGHDHQINKPGILRTHANATKNLPGSGNFQPVFPCQSSAETNPFGMVGGFVFDVVSMYQPFACSSFHVYIPTLAAS